MALFHNPFFQPHGLLFRDPVTNPEHIPDRDEISNLMLNTTKHLNMLENSTLMKLSDSSNIYLLL